MINPFDEIDFRLSKIEKILLDLTQIPNFHTNQPEPDHWLDINELVAYDPEKRSKATFYGYTSRKEIPFHKNCKKLVFLKSEIDHWLKQGRQKTNAEISAEADTYLKRRGMK
jgi:hypothetical protein